MIALDCEALGVDHYHGLSKPFLVTIVKDDGKQIMYEWWVDPKTRQPVIPAEDIREITDLFRQITSWGQPHYSEDIRSRHMLVTQNGKYDAAALWMIGVRNWPWAMNHDCLPASHVLASNQPHDLTSLALTYLNGKDIKPYEDRLRDACVAARRWAKKERSDWLLAEEGVPGLPSLKKSKGDKSDRGNESEKIWKTDCWLPRQVARERWQVSAACLLWQELVADGDLESAWRLARRAGGWTDHPPDLLDHYPLPADANPDLLAYLAAQIKATAHPWWTVTADYANVDSAVTWQLWPILEYELKQRGQWQWYLFQRKQMELAYRMEQYGITANLATMKDMKEDFQKRSNQCKAVCQSIAATYHYDLVLPKKGLNNSLRAFCFDVLKLPVVKSTKYTAKGGGGNPSLDKEAIAIYEITLEPNSPALRFINNLVDARTMDTGIGFLESYDRYGIPVPEHPGWVRLHPNPNPFGTDTTRYSIRNPGGQQISKQERVNLRKGFGPLPGRVWYSADAKNIELRIPAYRAPEPEFIALFEKMDEPPYYGSLHLLNFHTIYPDIWEQELAEVGLEKVGPHVKTKYDGSWYTYGKSCGLGIQYRAGRKTADKAAHRAGSFDRIMARFAGIHGPGGLNDRCLRQAVKTGYIETVPNRNIDGSCGYPLMVARRENDRIKDTTPLNYMVQGSAGVWMKEALENCQKQLDTWYVEEAYDCHITLTVHDEIVFDAPDEPRWHNDDRMRILKKIMEAGGDAIDVPTPVTLERHRENWAVGEEVS